MRSNVGCCADVGSCVPDRLTVPRTGVQLLSLSLQLFDRFNVYGISYTLIMLRLHDPVKIAVKCQSAVAG